MCRPSGEVSLEAIVREAVAALSAARADRRHHARDVGARRTCRRSIGERDELIQLFQNLIHNAIKYGRHGGHVWVTLGRAAAPGGRGAEQMLSASVRDDGEGIPPDAVPRLTERFYRVDVKRSREKGGTGLGLAIVKHIVNRHQGRLHDREPRRARAARSRCFCLPAAPADAALSRNCYKTVA